MAEKVEPDYAEAARVMFEACHDRFMRPEQCYEAIDALAQAGFITATPDRSDDALAEENAVLRERGARLVIAYHTAICSPKGVVPMDEFYDPELAREIQQRMDDLTRAALKGDGL